MKPNGPSKYDEACTAAREMTKAEVCLLLVLGGDKGSGFSMQTHDLGVVAKVPALLRHIADQIEQQDAEAR